VSWTHASQGVMWAAPGANGAGIDRKGLPVAEVECYEPAADADGWIDLDVTDAALYWLAHPAENFGLIVKGYRCGHTTLYRLSASEAGDPALRPQMALGYLPLEPVEVETATPTLTPMPTATGTPSLAPTATATATPTASATATAETAGVVAGHVWLDIVRNGIWQAGEPGLAGATVRLYRDGMPVGNAITPADGGYAFAGLEPGEYVVVETDPAGYGSTTGNNRAVTVVAGGCAEVDFGDYLMDTPTATHTLSPTLTATPEVALVFTPTAMPARGWLPLVWK